MTRRVYKNPPIEEALAEFRFAPGPEWDMTVPGRIHEAVKAEYPGKPRQQNLVTANVVFGAAEAAPALSMFRGIGRVQFPSQDERSLVGVGPDVLSVHVLRPYPGWESFRPRIENALTTYERVAAPSGVVRVGIRYINRITIRDTKCDLSRLFLCAPPQAPGLPSDTTSFLHRDEYRYGDDIKLLVTYASVEAADDCTSFVLDLDLISEGGEARALGSTMSLVDDLRERERKAFEALITDDLRKVFDED